MNLTVGMLKLNSSSVTLIPESSSGLGYLLVDFVWQADESLPNLLDFGLMLHSALGYLSVDGQKMTLRQKDGLWKTSETRRIEEANNKSIEVRTQSMFVDTAGISLLRVQYNLSSDNKVLPSVFLIDLVIKNNADNTIFSAYNFTLETGCKRGCSMCFIEDTNKCIKCHPGYEIESQTCTVIIPLATVFELVGTGYSLGRSHSLVASIFGTVFTLFSRRFFSRSYWNIWSTEVVTKVVIANVVTIVVLFRLLSDVDDMTAMQLFWVTYLSVNVMVSSFLTLFFWILSSPYPILRPTKNSKIALHVSYALACLSSAANILATVADVVVLDRLVLEKEKREEATDKATSLASAFAIREGIRQREEEIEIVPRSRRSRSLDDDSAGHWGSPTKAGATRPFNLARPQVASEHSQTKGQTPASQEEKLFLLDYLNVIRWVNCSIKSCLVVIVIVLSVLGSYAPWTRAPLEVLLVVAVELYFTIRYPVQHQSIEPWRKAHEKHAYRRIKRAEFEAVRVLNSTEKEKGSDPMQESSDVQGSKVQQKPEINENEEFEQAFNQDMSKKYRSSVGWRGLINSLLDKSEMAFDNDSLSFNTGSIMEKAEKKFLNFIKNSKTDPSKPRPSGLIRSNSAGSSRESHFDKMAPVKFILDGLTKHHDAILRSDFDNSDAESFGEEEESGFDGSEFDFLKELKPAAPVLENPCQENQPSKGYQKRLIFKEFEEDDEAQQ